MRIVLSKIATLQTNPENNNAENVENNVCFKYNNKTWRLLDPFTETAENSNSLLEIIKHCENTKLKIVEFVESREGNELIALYRNDVYIKKSIFTAKLIDKIFEALFRGSNKCRIIKDELVGSTDKHILKTYVTTKLFEALQNQHNIAEGPQTLEDDVQESLPAKFLPVLCNYQKKSVMWLLSKERSPAKFTPFFNKLESKDNQTVVYKHTHTPYVQNDTPAELDLPPGGILADEMGLGKTVEILALILLNPLRPDTPDPRWDMLLRSSSAKRKRLEVEIFCTCTSNSQRKIIQCSKCLLWQHSKCVAKYNDDHDDEVNNQPYLCPSCWQIVVGEVKLFKSKGTLIVSPNTIKLQWLSEIRRHIQPSLRVFLYEGVVAGKWVSPRQLANYDVVLTDYNVLSKEIYYIKENVSERTMRNKPRSIRMHTPILMLEWWRVCLDEAQMVESNTSNAASLVRMIPAINRWAISGTPIQRSLNDLQPLLKFVGFEAITEENTWNYLVSDFLVHHDSCSVQNTPELVNVLQKCMWRTCKSQISDELQIPPQQQIVHRIQFDNLEKLFYNEQHADCRANFMGNVRKYTSNLSSISPQIMKVILQPFLKIRQSCTMPVVVINSTTSRAIISHQKQFLQPQELHEYLKSTNEISCKTELRAMASSHNGLAALYFLQRKHKEAIKHYDAVLKLANDYSQMNITVDSLLQIHALHNLIQIKIIANGSNGKLPSPCLEPYESQCNTLEWKYLSTYSNTLSNVMTSYQTAISKINAEVSEHFVDSMAEALVNAKTSDISILLQKIQEECLIRFGSTNIKLDEIQSTHSLLYIVDLWFKKVDKVLKTLKSEVENLKYFSDNVKSRNQVSPAIWRSIMELVQSVYDCHLSEIRISEKEKKEKLAKRRKIKCKMCGLRDLINSFECMLFDKVIDETSNFTEGLENPSFEMFVCKVTFTYLKNKYTELQSSGRMESNWLYLENLQIVCKRLIKLWIEMEYTIKAYDELNMCKMRISLTDDPDDKSIYKIFTHEIAQRIEEQQGELHMAQRQFTIKLARLKYIKHLEGDEEMGPCPICRLLEEDRYVVLECGHHICFQCLKSIQQYSRGSSFKCSVCRNTQQHQNLYYVSRSKARRLENHPVKGHYSSKITYIVRLILKLQNQDEWKSTSNSELECNDAVESRDLKILIFSQWAPILQAISVALKENNITFRNQCSPKALDEFKNPKLGVTCLLMPFVKGSKGLNLVEATYVFLVEPILNPGEELQAIGRVHRFGQTRSTTVHRFIMSDSIEENIYEFISSSPSNVNSSGVEHKWEFDNVSLEDFEKLFVLKSKNDYE